MKNKLEFLQKWFEKRNARDRLYLFISGFAFLYLSCFVFFLRPLSVAANDLKQQIAALNMQQTAVQQQINTIKNIIQDPVFSKMLITQNTVTLKLNTMQQQLDHLQPALISDDDLLKLTKHILSLEHDNYTLISLEQLPVAPWVAQNGGDKTNVSNTPSGIEQHLMQIEFQNDYFTAISYLEKLEKISAYIYWDSMVYKVLKYPKADIVVKFHVLSLKKS